MRVHITVKWLLTLSPLVASLLAINPLIHFFQLESYQFPGYFQTLRRNKKRAYLPGLLVTVSTIVLYAIFDRLASVASSFMEVVFAIAVFVFSFLIGLWVAKFFNNPNSKKPLKYTARIKRLYVVTGMMFIGLAAIHVYFSPLAILILVVPLLLPYFVALGGLLAWPVEKMISEWYFQDAKRVLKERNDLIKIGITGSYGKTSVKFILDKLLSEKYNVLSTPGSYNTPMGVTWVIREKLKPSHQIFLAEMGARRKGDIKELCRLVHPSIGVITSVGPQHLETFKTVERVAATKYELIENLNPKGQGFFINDNAMSLALYQKASVCKTLIGLKPNQGDLWAEDIKVSAKGTQFTVVFENGKRINGSTTLLGTHNIHNILLAVSIANSLGLSHKQIERGIGKLEAIEHRLQLRYNPVNETTTIDDAFNSNPQGALSALEVLSQFDGRKIIITPGMVEMGKDEETYNEAFGKAMAKVVDIAILVGKKQTKPIVLGLEKEGFPKKKTVVVSSLEESTIYLNSIIQPGDVILYENDLPDNYTEE